MEAVKYLTDEEIRDVLWRIGIRQKYELDNATAEYKKYWWTTYFTKSEIDNNKNSFIQTIRM